jgi:hypothetical protein
MKKLAIVLLGLAFIFGLTQVVAAAPITFTDTTEFTATGTTPGGDLDDYGWGEVNKLDGILNYVDGMGPLGSDYVAWTHHFDFNPPALEVLSGSLSIQLYDDQVKEYKWFRWTGNYIDDKAWEFGGGIAEDGNYDLGEVDTGTYSFDVTASYLEDGAFSILLGSLGGDFYISQSDLTIEYNPVPEPATILLMGVGLLGLAGFSRKKMSKRG